MFPKWICVLNKSAWWVGPNCNYQSCCTVSCCTLIPNNVYMLIMVLSYTFSSFIVVSIVGRFSLIAVNAKQHFNRVHLYQKIVQSYCRYNLKQTLVEAAATYNQISVKLRSTEKNQSRLNCSKCLQIFSRLSWWQSMVIALRRSTVALIWR